jgi:hypothetical protein
MSVHSRYKKEAKKLEIKADTKRGAEMLDKVSPAQNRHQRRAQMSAAMSKRGLLVTRRGK